ncbi:MAG: hypothetical protein ACI4J1_02925 [Ruminiclostridium sp.]
MLSIKKSAANEYYLGCAYNEDGEIFFGATDKNLPATIKKAVTGRENDIMDLFGGRRKVGSFMIDFTMFQGNSALVIESAYALYTNIGQSIPLAKAESVAKDLNKLLKGTDNAYCLFVIIAMWNMLRRNKHLAASKLINFKPLETCERYAKEFRANYKRLFSLNEKKRLVKNSEAITISLDCGYTVIYAKAEYIAELKRRKIYCRKCKACGEAILFSSKNNLLCDKCTKASIAHSKKAHRLVENGDSILRKNKRNLTTYYNYSHSKKYMESSPEKQREFQRLFKQYKERAKEIIRQYKESEITRKNASDELSKINDRIFKFIREDN